MSSRYSAICLSHDPGLTIGPDLTYQQAQQLNGRDRLGDHQACDIVIGRWSGGLIEVACPGLELPGPTACARRHSGIEWIDADWLRLLHAARPVVDGDLLGRHTFRCWTPDRLNRLRDELGLQPHTEEWSLDETCATFSEHGWGRCVEPRDHAPGKHMYRHPKPKEQQ